MQAKFFWSVFQPSRSELVNTRFPNSLTVKIGSPQALVPMETTQQWLFKLWSSAYRVWFLGHLMIKRGDVFNKTFSANFTVRIYPFTIVKVVQNISLPSSIISKKNLNWHHLAAYPLFLRVRRRCFIRTISSRVSPRSLSWRLRSRTDIVTNSSSLISVTGPGERGACNKFST